MHVYLFRDYLREFIHKNEAANKERNYEFGFGAGVSDSCIITIITISDFPTSSITENQDKECVDASTNSGERGAYVY